MNTHFTHLSSEVYPDATKYDPYRWLKAEKEGTKAELEKFFNPFGKGSRNCVGLKYVLSSPFVCSFLFLSLVTQTVKSLEADDASLDVVLQTQRCI